MDDPPLRPGDRVRVTELARGRGVYPRGRCGVLAYVTQAGEPYVKWDGNKDPTPMTMAYLEREPPRLSA
jgi:hypothetical protein